MAHSIPCDGGRSYIGKTGRPLAMWYREHLQNLSLQKIKISPTRLQRESQYKLRFLELKVTARPQGILNQSDPSTQFGPHLSAYEVSNSQRQV
jgi:hypothetical protein